MGKMRLFQAAVVWHPDLDKESEENMSSEILVEPYTTLEVDETTLAYKLVRKLDEKYINQMKQIEIIVRPF